MKKEVITELNAKAPVSEMFRALRTNLQFMNKAKKNQTILITSTIQGEGKSWVAANLAVTFAQTGRNVILIDADMRRPRQNKIFSIKQYPGLSNILSGISEAGLRKKVILDECIQETDVKNLYILSAGNIPPNPSELLLSDKLSELINEVENNFDVVIFDGAPTLLVTDSTIISRLVDLTLLVASQGLTKIDDLKLAKKKIKNVGGKIAGVVLNRVKVSDKKYNDRYYYSSETNMPSTKIRKKTRTIEIYENEKVNNYEEKKINREEENTEQRIKKEIEKNNIDRFSTMQEVPSEQAKKILESIKSYK